jgi:hypothetical protein
MSASGTFVVINPGDKKDLILHNLVKGETTVIPMKNSVLTLDLATSGDILAIADSVGISNIDLKTMAVKTVTKQELNSGLTWCKAIDAKSDLCFAVARDDQQYWQDLMIVDLVAKTMKPMTSLTQEHQFDNSNYTISPNGRFVYYLLFDEYKAPVHLHRFDLGLNKDEMVAETKTGGFYSLSANSHGKESVYFYSNSTDLMPNDLDKHFDVYEWSE